MSRNSPFLLILSPAEREELERRSRRYTLPFFQVIRAKMILLAAAGVSNEEIARRLDVGREVVSQWRQRFFRARLSGLDDLPRAGRPATERS